MYCHPSVPISRARHRTITLFLLSSMEDSGGILLMETLPILCVRFWTNCQHMPYQATMSPYSENWSINVSLDFMNVTVQNDYQCIDGAQTLTSTQNTKTERCFCPFFFCCNADSQRLAILSAQNESVTLHFPADRPNCSSDQKSLCPKKTERQSGLQLNPYNRAFHELL